MRRRKTCDRDEPGFESLENPPGDALGSKNEQTLVQDKGNAKLTRTSRRIIPSVSVSCAYLSLERGRIRNFIPYLHCALNIGNSKGVKYIF